MAKARSGRHTFKPGDRFEHYRIVKKLGEGGMGAVYQVYHPALDATYALKILFPDVAEREEGFVDRFVREARLSSRLHHANLISVYDAGRDIQYGMYYLVMDFVNGGSVRDRLKQSGRLYLEDAFAVILQMLSALTEAKKNNMVHRDIKPDNIMYTQSGVVKLADLGIAKSMNEFDATLTMESTVFGTPAYMSPEQARDSKSVDCRADIYSLGIVFYEMLTGRCPYRGTPMAVVAQILSPQEIPDVRQVKQDIPEDVAVIIAKMCAKKLDSRYASPEEVIADMEKLLDSGMTAESYFSHIARKESGSKTSRKITQSDASTVVATRETWEKEWRRSKKRKRFLYAAAAVFLFAGLLYGCYAIYHHISLSRAEAENLRMQAAKQKAEREAKRIAAEKEAAEKEAKRIAAEKEVAEREARRIAEANKKLQAEQDATEKEAERIAKEKAAAEAEAARIAAEKEAAEREAAERIKKLQDSYAAAQMSIEKLNEEKKELELHVGKITDERSVLQKQLDTLKSLKDAPDETRMNRIAFLEEKIRQLNNEKKIAEKRIRLLEKLIAEKADADHTADQKEFLARIEAERKKGIKFSQDGKVLTKYTIPFYRKETTYHIPSGVVEISTDAFKNNRNLRYITVPDTVKYIGDSAFYACSALEKIDIPDSVISVGPAAFSDCKKLKSITLNNVTEIKSQTFQYCESLESVSMGKATKIGGWAFLGCRSLTQLPLHEGIAEIGMLAFFGCDNIKSVYIPDSLIRFGDGVFSNCKNLKNISVKSDKNGFFVEDDILFRKLNDGGIQLLCYPAGKDGTAYTSSFDITDYSYAFCGNRYLKKIVLPKRLKQPDTSFHHAFNGCTSLSTVTLPRNIKVIGVGMFQGCTSLRSIKIPETVTIIRQLAFDGCKKLGFIKMPEDVVVEEAAFRGTKYEESFRKIY